MEQTPIQPAQAPAAAVLALPGGNLPIMPATIAARLLSRHSAHEIAEAIEVLVDLLDCLGGDPEAEAATWPNDIHSRAEPALPDDFEPTGDEQDAAWAEWHTRGRHKLAGGLAEPFDRAGEDNEEDDPAGQCDEDGVNTSLALAVGHGAGCTISDPDKGSEDESEREQMPNDVPALQVWSLEYNMFTDKRLSLGISNLQTSFRGGGARSADTGNVLRTNWRAPLKPGVPV